MKVTVLGSGTSHGIPIIGCSCEVCTSPNPKNRRTRCSIWVEVRGLHLLVDVAPEFRLQAVRDGLRWVDAVLLTHTHADHIMGMDDLRIFSQRSRRAVPIYGSPEALKVIRRVFAYVFEPGQEGGGKPQFDLREVRGPFSIRGVPILPILVYHGRLPVYAYRIGDFAYVTDVSFIPAASLEQLRGVRWLILDALRYEPHPTHFSVGEALQVVEILKPEQTYLTHLCHRLEHERDGARLPPGVAFAYDGLRWECSDPPILKENTNEETTLSQA